MDFERDRVSPTAWAPVDAVGEEWGERMNRAAFGAVSSVSFSADSVSHSVEISGPSPAGAAAIGLNDRLKVGGSFKVLKWTLSDYCTSV